MSYADRNKLITVRRCAIAVEGVINETPRGAPGALLYVALAPFLSARDAPRVPFLVLVERGLISAGARLTDAKRKHKAMVRPDGAIVLGNNIGSIHRIGALAQGLDACNGWTFWHVETPKGLTLIDELRAVVRAEMSVAAE